MTAIPADIAKYTTDGVVVRAPASQATSDAIKAEHVDARDLGDREIEMFFDFATDAQAMLDERFEYLSKVDPLHIGVEVEDALGIGDSIAISPRVPCFLAVDGDRSVIVRTRAYALDMERDRFSVEIQE